MMGDTFQTECNVCEEVTDCLTVDTKKWGVVCICEDCYLEGE